MDINKAFRFIFDDKQWISKLLIGVLMTLTSFLIVPALILQGYLVKIIRQVRDGQDNELPEWSDYGDLLRYTLSSYLRDRHRVTSGVGANSSEGCTTWAAVPPTARHGHMLLAKNRDYHRDHIPLQTLASVKPDDGYCYLCIGSAGSPTVFSSGINERGLACLLYTSPSPRD